MFNISRLFVKKKDKSKKVVIIAANGYSGILNPATSDESVSKTLSETFTPLEVDGRQIWKLTELKSYIYHKKGWSSSLIKHSATEVTKVTYLNGILLFNHLLKAGFDPIIINDFQEDQNILTDALEGGLLAAAISTTFLPFKEHVEPIVSFIRQRRQDVPIIIGGPMVYLSKDLFLNPDPNYDPETLKRLYLFYEPDNNINYYIIDRRGENTLVKLLYVLLEDREPSNVRNLGIQTGNGIHFTPIEPEKVDVSYEDVDWNHIPDHVLKHTVSLRASTGCPFKCEFCNFHFYASELLFRPMPALIKELDQLSKRSHVKHISFVDDNFLISHKKIETFCRTLIDRNYPFTWSSFIRTDSINTENIGLVADSGAHLLMFGVESGDTGVLLNMNKKSNIDHVLEVVNGLGERGISTFSTIIIGFPGETRETVDHTISFLNNYRSSVTSIHWHSPFLFILLPKTRVERHREKYDLRGFMLNWRHNTMDVKEAALQLKRFMLKTEGACYPISTEHPLAANALGITPDNAVKLIKLIDKYLKNQMQGKDNGDTAFQERNKAIFDDIEEIFLNEKNR